MEKQAGFSGCTLHTAPSPRRLIALPMPPGGYFSKPNAEYIAAVIEEMMKE
jgi:hypothetical protein